MHKTSENKLHILVYLQQRISYNNGYISHILLEHRVKFNMIIRQL